MRHLLTRFTRTSAVVLVSLALPALVAAAPASAAEGHPNGSGSSQTSTHHQGHHHRAHRGRHKRVFRSPNREVGCVVKRSHARCTVVQNSWTVPPKPSSCSNSWGTKVGGGRVAGHLVCAKRPGYHHPKARVLKRGHKIRVGHMVCRSLHVGVVRCHNRRTHHGFRVSKAAYHLF